MVRGAEEMDGEDGQRGWTKEMDGEDGRRGWARGMGKGDGRRGWAKGMSEGDERKGWAEEMVGGDGCGGPKPRETVDAEAGILRMDSAAANRGQESQEAGTKADERLGQEAADGRQGRKTPAQGTGNGELKGSRTLTKGTENSELEGSETPAKRTRNDELKEPGTPVVKGVKPTEAK